MTKEKKTVGQTTTSVTEKGSMSNEQVINKAKLDAWQTLAERMIEASAHNRTSDREGGWDGSAALNLRCIRASLDLIENIENGWYDNISDMKNDDYVQEFLDANYYEYGRILVDWLTNQIGVDEELAKEMAYDVFGNEDED